jgi:geranylgeranyl pyrophosphate synthase
VRPMLTWAILAGASVETQNNIAELGLHLGLAFQVRDDLMDITW